MVVSISALEQDTYPPRVAIALTGLTLGDQVAIYREVTSVRTLVRGGSVDSAPDTGFVVVDDELPFGVPVAYVGVVEGSEYSTTPTTYDLPGGKVALTDAITGLVAEVVIVAAGEKVYARDSTRFRVGGRNIVVSSPLPDAEGSYELVVDTTTLRDALMELLAGATQGVVQIRQPGLSLVSGDPYDGIDAYLAVDRVTERRYSQDGSDPRRLITIEFAEVEGWSDDLTARGFTYGDVEAYYTGVTYGDVAGEFSTYLDAMQGDFS